MQKPSVNGGYFGNPDLIPTEYFKAPRNTNLPHGTFGERTTHCWWCVILAACVAAVLLGMVVADSHVVLP
jgi:hypothetical protein